VLGVVLGRFGPQLITGCGGCGVGVWGLEFPPGRCRARAAKIAVRGITLPPTVDVPQITIMTPGAHDQRHGLGGPTPRQAWAPRFTTKRHYWPDAAATPPVSTIQ
jgi:hypothetical protein